MFNKIIMVFLLVVGTAEAATDISGRYAATAGLNCEPVLELDRELNKKGYFLEVIKVGSGKGYKAVLPKAGGAESDVAWFENGNVKFYFKGKGNEIILTLKEYNAVDNTLMLNRWVNNFKRGTKVQTFDILNDDFPKRKNPIKAMSSNKGLCLSKMIANSV